MASSTPLSEQRPEETDNPAEKGLKSDLGRNDSSEPSRQYLKEREDLTNPDNKDNAPAGIDGEDLLTDGGLGPEQSLYNNSGAAPSKTKGFWRGPLSGRGWRRKRLAITAAVLAASAAAAIAIFLSLLPLKILHIVNNLQSHFYSSAQSATEKETNQLMSQYIRRTLWSQKCGKAVIDRNCTPASLISSNPVERLYHSWRNAKLENTLADKYGLEFRYNTSTGHYYMRHPNLTSDVEIDDFMDSDQSLDDYFDSSPKFQKVSRAELRQTVNDAFNSETRWQQTMIRFKVARLLEEKYGIPRCIFFCGTRDKLADSVTAQKNAAKIAVARLVFEPRNKELSIAIKCLLDTNCQPEQTKSTPCQEGTTCEMSSAPINDQTEGDMETSLEGLAADYGIEDTSSLVSLYTELEEKGLSQYMIEQVFAYVFGDAAGQAAGQNISDAIPLIGWVNLASQIIGNADNAGPKLKKLDYLVNTGSAVSLFATYRVYADEIKTGHVNATEIGSLVDSLGPVADSEAKDLKGGTGGAESTPLYNYLINSGAVTGSSKYLCDNGKPPAGGSVIQAVCPEEKPGQGNNIANYIHQILNYPGLSLLTSIANIWNGTIGSLLSFFGNFISWVSSPVISLADKTCSLPTIAQGPFAAYCASRDLIKEGATQVANAAINFLIPNPFSTNMSGGRTFDMLAAGADTSGNDYAHTGLGGEVLTPQQTATIINQQAGEQKLQYDHQSFFARLFDTNSQYSPAVKIATAMPTSFGSFQVGLSNFFIHPSHLFGSISNIFPHANAAAPAAADPFGITQYGYPNNDPIFQTDPSVYWNQHCADNPSQAYQNDQDFANNSWNNQAANGPTDATTGMPVNTTTNPCLLINSTVGSDGALFDSNLLTQDDLGG